MPLPIAETPLGSGPPAGIASAPRPLHQERTPSPPIRKKGKWADAAKRAGLAKADGERLNTRRRRPLYGLLRGLDTLCFRMWPAACSAI